MLSLPWETQVTTHLPSLFISPWLSRGAGHLVWGAHRGVAGWQHVHAQSHHTPTLDMASFFSGPEGVLHPDCPHH